MKGLLWLLLLILPFSGCQGQIYGCNSRLIGQASPAGSLIDFSTSRPLTLESLYQDAPVLLSFWASWCPSCRDEIKTLNEFAQKYQGKIKVVGVNAGESKEEIGEFLKNHPIDYQVLMDETTQVAESYQVSGLPTMILLAKGGKILYYGFNLPRDLDRLLTQGA